MSGPLLARLVVASFVVAAMGGCVGESTDAKTPPGGPRALEANSPRSYGATTTFVLHNLRGPVGSGLGGQLNCLRVQAAEGAIRILDGQIVAEWQAASPFSERLLLTISMSADNVSFLPDGPSPLKFEWADLGHAPDGAVFGLHLVEDGPTLRQDVRLTIQVRYVAVHEAQGYGFGCEP